MRAREYYSCALISGMRLSEARHQLPGFILDMYKLRVEHEARAMGVKVLRRHRLL